MNGLLWEKEIRQAEHVRLLGRLDPQQPVLSMFLTGSGVELRLRCTTLDMEIEADYEIQCPWIGVLVDGAPVARFALSRGRHFYTLLGGMDETVAHTVTVLRDTQPVLEDGRLSVRAHRLRSDGELLPLPARSLGIEFIGDSLTSGEGLTGPRDAMEWRTIWLSGMETWAAEVCRRMNAQGRWISQSGWGVYWSWDANREHCIARIYDQICPVERGGSALYDFEANPVEAVVINLGTNDAAALSHLKGRAREEAAAAITHAAADFIRQVRKKNPQAYILWAYGMCGEEAAPLLRSAVRTVRREGDRRVGYIRLPACARENLGSREHPGRSSHLRAARAVTKRLQEALAAQKQPAQRGKGEKHDQDS